MYIDSDIMIVKESGGHLLDSAGNCFTILPTYDSENGKQVAIAYQGLNKHYEGGETMGNDVLYIPMEENTLNVPKIMKRRDGSMKFELLINSASYYHRYVYNFKNEDDLKAAYKKALELGNSTNSVINFSFEKAYCPRYDQIALRKEDITSIYMSVEVGD